MRAADLMKLYARRTGGLCALSCIFLVMLGCSGKRSVDHVEVTGKVTYKDKPVTGGEVVFLRVVKEKDDQAFSATGRIDENGNYSIKAPIGEVKITVNNTMLMPGNQATKTGQVKGAGRPGSGEPEPIKGKYVDIPTKYRNVEHTDITTTITKDTKTYDIQLK